jgi:hypothetical protein
MNVTRNDANTALLVIAALVIGFLVALLVFRDDDGGNAAVTGATTGTPATSTTTTSGTAAGTSTTQTTTSGAASTPTSGAATIGDCINLWNQPSNRGAQTFLINIASQQPVRVHVGETSDVPPQCLITIVGSGGDAWIFPEGGGSTYPYAPAPSRETASELPSEQRKSNALEQRDGTLTQR